MLPQRPSSIARWNEPSPTGHERQRSRHKKALAQEHLAAPGIGESSASQASHSFHQTLSHAMNKIGVCRSKASGAQIAGDLSAVVRRVRCYMKHDVLFAAGPTFPFGVLITDLA